MRCGINEYCTKLPNLGICACVSYNLNEDEAENCAEDYATCTVGQDNACCNNSMPCVPNSKEATEGTCKPYDRSTGTIFGDANSDDECVSVEKDCTDVSDCEKD